MPKERSAFTAPPKNPINAHAVPRLTCLSSTDARLHPAPPPNVPHPCLGRQGPAPYSAYDKAALRSPVQLNTPPTTISASGGRTRGLPHQSM